MRLIAVFSQKVKLFILLSALIIREHVEKIHYLQNMFSLQNFTTGVLV